jgi:polar amino acid transport system permease protein
MAMSLLFKIYPQLLQGVLVTLNVTVWAFCVVVVVSLIAGLARLSNLQFVRTIATVYVEIFRGVSALVQLFWLFFVLPLFGVTLAPMIVAIFGLGFCLGAYGSEIVRSAILSVSQGQRDAALSLGMSPIQQSTLVVLPQAIPNMLPAFGNVAIDLLKQTSLVSLITLQDLTFQAQSANQGAFQTVTIFSAVLVIYFILSLVITSIFRALEFLFNRQLERGEL